MSKKSKEVDRPVPRKLSPRKPGTVVMVSGQKDPHFRRKEPSNAKPFSSWKADALRLRQVSSGEAAGLGSYLKIEGLLDKDRPPEEWLLLLDQYRNRKI